MEIIIVVAAQGVPNGQRQWVRRSCKPMSAQRLAGPCKPLLCSTHGKHREALLSLGVLPETLRSLPYLVHTNRELGLMLMRTKPLATFSYIDGYEVDRVLRYLRMFDRHVAAGRFTRHDKVSPLRQLGGRLYHQIFFTLPGEAWRAEAMLELLALPGAWSNERERRFGTLLGYEDWQNDIWLHRHPIL